MNLLIFILFGSGVLKCIYEGEISAIGIGDPLTQHENPIFFWLIMLILSYTAFRGLISFMTSFKR